MLNAFILRFQERCDALAGFGSAAGTSTVTEVKSEHVDSDPDRRRHGVFGTRSQEVGTITKTAIPREGGDVDRDLGAVPIIPRTILSRRFGTQTLTFVRAEGADQDPGRHYFSAVPQCSSS
jgi:hypothetical protein